ncbi:MAG: peptide ABC transporter substrate-binding protein [Phycisphaerae bacterium]|nr:peptide ABC transporter substrate-binding protein [Phycisphaerae bacterium]
MLRPPVLLAIAVVLGCATLFAVRSRASHSAAPTDDALLSQPADLTFIDRGDVTTLDLIRLSWMQDIRMAYNLFEGLYRLDPATLTCIPGVADKIDASPDKTHFTFHIRSNARWSNGDPVTSADFVFAWRRMLQVPRDYTYLYHYIRGAQAYEDAYGKDVRTADFSTVGIKAPDLATIEVTLAHPLTFFPDLCAFVPFFPSNEKAMEPWKHVDPATGRTTYDEKFTRPGSLVTNGAYKLTAWTLKVGMRIDANPYFWDAASVKTKSVHAIVAEDALVGLRKYDNHEVDWLAEPNGDVSAGLIAQHRPDIHVCPSNGTYFLSFNCQPFFADKRPNPLADARVRRALSLAIDKRPIVEKITRCGEPIANDYIPPGIFADYHSPAGLQFDVRAARRLLTEAGYPGGRGFPPITYLVNSEGDHRIIAEYITKQWKDQLNLDIDMESVEIAEFRERLHGKRYAVARAGWYGDYNDLSTFTDKYLSDSDNNDAGWVNKEYDAICHQAAVEPDVATRNKLIEEAETMLLDEAPICPIYIYTNRYVFRDSVRDLYLNARNVVLFPPITTGRF